MSASEPLPPDLEEFRETYIKLFGLVPPLPSARFHFTGAVDPEDLRLAEAYRAHAYHNAVFDDKITQIMVFLVLVTAGSAAAKWHAISARRAGATWEELQMAVSIASVASALGPANVGGGVLDELYRASEADATKQNHDLR